MEDNRPKTGEVLIPAKPRSIGEIIMMIADLRDDARANGFESLHYFLGMALMEAQFQENALRRKIN